MSSPPKESLSDTLGDRTPIRLLNLEDEPADAELIRMALEDEGLDCEIAKVDTREAFIAALETRAFHLIISDFALPGFDGLSALSIVRAQDPDIPFILVSGTIGEEMAIESLKAGATDYILKDRLSRLGPCVRRALHEAAERRRLRRAEVTLRESEEKYRTIVEATREWIWEADTEGRLTYSNAAVADILGYPAQEMAGRDALPLLHLDDLGIAQELMADAAARKAGWSGVVMRWRHRDGHYRYLESNGVPIVNEQGEVGGFRGADRDITERKQLEAQLRQSQKMEAIGTLAGGIAHDFNNLLTTILGYSDLVLTQVDENMTFRPDLEEIKRAGERAASLTRQLLAFSRKQVLRPVVLDLNAVVRELEKMLSRLIGEDIALTADLDEKLAPVQADPGQIEQVIMNLVVNARDAMPQGGRVAIETRNVELDEAYVHQHPYVTAGPFALLSVTDTGLGMDAETRSRIFEPFFTTKGPGKGTGLGLSTVYGIVKQSGGHIEVSSEPGRGTTFGVYLPRATGTKEAIYSGEQREIGSRPGSETVLLVEDEDAVRALARRILEKNGYVVLESSSAEEAIALAENRRGPIDLMLTDAIMPGESGAAAARRLQSSRPDMKVLFMSGYTDDAIARVPLVKSTDSFLQKPFSPEALAEKVRRVLDGRPKAEADSLSP